MDELFLLEPHAVQLDGPLDDSLQKTIERWCLAKVPYDEFVSFFVKGRPKFAAGEMWGKAVRAASLFYWYTNDQRLKTVLAQTVQDLLATERSNGSISCSPIDRQPDPDGGDLWERKYVYLGLERYYSLVNPDPAVLASLVRQMDCLLQQVGPAPKMRVIDSGWSVNSIESCTILEPVMRVYGLTQDKRYLEFAEYLIEEGGAKGCNLIDQALAEVPPHQMADGEYPKAYEMLSFFEGLIEYHRVTGSERIGSAVERLYNSVLAKEITVAGSGGNDLYHSTGECWGDSAYEQSNPDIHRMMETCVGVTWLKFCAQRLRLTGDPSVIDAMETYIYNGLIGAQRPDGDTFSYANLLNGKKDNPLGWGVYFYDKGRITCCELNGPMGLAIIPTVAVMTAATGPVVNLYNAGTFRVKTPGGQTAKLHIVSDYPVSGRVELAVELDQPEAFDLRLRIPAWSARTAIQVNGDAESAVGSGYHTLDREWQHGDRVALELDMACRLIESPRGDGRCAVVYGPTVLARDENRDADFDQAVDIVAAAGRIDAKVQTPDCRFVRMQLRVPTAGGAITMIDYASCDNWNGRHTCTWMPAVVE